MAVRLLMVGAKGSEFYLAAEMARDAGAEAMTAETPEEAMNLVRTRGADMAMVDVGADVAAVISLLRRERFSLPVLACGIDVPAEDAVAAIRAGALDYVPLPPQRDLIAAAIASIVTQPASRLIGSDPRFLRTTSFALAMARAEAPMLIAGEAGTGKEALARAVHHASGRTGPFLSLDCAGATREVIESALFGHEKAAFSGASERRLGELEKAAGGTLFLRAIDRLALPTQAKLAAILRSGVARRLGDGGDFIANARVIAGTSQDLEALIADGSFRADLLSRLSFARVVLPPLRERTGDIASLATYFAERWAMANGVMVRPIRPEAFASLEGHSWPGNLRELEDVIHRAVLLEEGASIGTDAFVLLDGSRLGGAPQRSAAAGVEDLVGLTVEEVERDLILRTLERCHGNRTSASGILGISVRTMRNKLRSFIDAGIAVVPS